MIIKSLTLTNFRQFVNEQTIEFSTNEQKKATLIIAENGTGKTTIIEAFSWVLYGTTSLKDILNTEQKEKLKVGECLTISGLIKLIHLSVEYSICRTQKITKTANRINRDESVLTVTYKDDNGILKEMRGISANNEVNNIVPEELFPYFFFKGENIERIGKDLNTTKSTKNNEFVKAIKGMLGFAWLYRTREDLKTVSNQYNAEIESNKSDGKLAELAKRERETNENIETYTHQLSQLMEEIDKLNTKKEELFQQIIQSKDVEFKQKEARELELKCHRQKEEIKIAKKKLFERFSEKSFALFASQLINQALEILENEGNVDKGIPGLEASAVEYLLEKKECLCGTPLLEESEEYNKMKELIKYLPPYNIGHEIKLFQDRSDSTQKLSTQGYDDFIERRKSLASLTSNYNNDVEKLHVLNDEIKAYDDVSAIKKEELDCGKTLDMYNKQLWKCEDLLDSAKNDYERINKERDNYSVTDNRNKKVIECKKHVDSIINQIEKYCSEKESEKRIELQNAINSIFKDIFKVGITITLDENFNIIKTSDDVSDLSGYEASTSQDAIMAFSFIGGIIKLARNKISAAADEDFLDVDNEPYPLVMDAPSSSFDITRIKNFCDLMPKIAEQVIFFIKDTDGLYVKDYLRDVIGKEYVFKKVGNYFTKVEEA